MDLSKLPKFSNSGTPPPAEPVPIAQQAPVAQSHDPSAGERYTLPTAAPGVGPEIWFNTIVGLLVIFLGRTFAIYLFDRITQQPFHTGVVYTGGDRDGQEVPYPEVEGFLMLTDACLFLFGLVVLLEAAVKAAVGLGFSLPRTLVGLVLLLAVGMTAINLYACVRLMATGQIPIISGLAVAFGGYIIADIRQIYLRMGSALNSV